MKLPHEAKQREDEANEQEPAENKYTVEVQNILLQVFFTGISYHISAQRNSSILKGILKGIVVYSQHLTFDSKIVC